MKKLNWKQLCGLLLAGLTLLAFARVLPAFAQTGSSAVLFRLLLGVPLAIGLELLGVLKNRFSPLATLIPAAITLLLHAVLLFISLENSLLAAYLKSYSLQPTGSILFGICAVLGVKGLAQKCEWRRWDALYAIPFALLIPVCCGWFCFVGTFRGEMEMSLYRSLWNAGWLLVLGILPFVGCVRNGGAALLLGYGLWWLLAACVPVVAKRYFAVYGQLFLMLLLCGAGNVMLSFLPYRKTKNIVVKE